MINMHKMEKVKVRSFDKLMQCCMYPEQLKVFTIVLINSISSQTYLYLMQSKENAICIAFNTWHKPHRRNH